jgi:hypothetical protein
MNRKKFLQDFSRRLNEAMTSQGFDSKRSRTGVEVSKLAEEIGCSYQMSRKYVLGLALPDLPIVLQIAAWLKIAPSWLLFGENQTPFSREQCGAIIEISPDLLKYILTKCLVLYEMSKNPDKFVNFIVDTVYDAAHLKAGIKDIYKIIDMMVSSAVFFHEGREKQNKEIA